MIPLALKASRVSGHPVFQSVVHASCVYDHLASLAQCPVHQAVVNCLRSTVLAATLVDCFVRIAVCLLLGGGFLLAVESRGSAK